MTLKPFAQQTLATFTLLPFQKLSLINFTPISIALHFFKKLNGFDQFRIIIFFLKYGKFNKWVKTVIIISILLLLIMFQRCVVIADHLIIPTSKLLWIRYFQLIWYIITNNGTLITLLLSLINKLEVIIYKYSVAIIIVIVI